MIMKHDDLREKSQIWGKLMEKLLSAPSCSEKKEETWCGLNPGPFHWSVPPLMIKQQLEIALHAKYLQAVDSLRSDLQLDEAVQEDASPTTSKIQVITESANMESEYRCGVCCHDYMYCLLRWN